MKTDKKNLVEQVLAQVEGVVTDVRSWVELRLQLLQVETEDLVNGLILRLISVVLVLILGFFLLVTLALGIGMLLGHAFWGFLVLTSVMFLALFGLGVMRPRFWKFDQAPEIWAKVPVLKQLLPPSDPVNTDLMPPALPEKSQSRNADS